MLRTVLSNKGELQMTKFEFNGRTYQVTETQHLANLSAHLIKQGFDGLAYFATSYATGKQRKDFCGMFFKSVKTGQFTSA
jgi:hypothetical protein